MIKQALLPEFDVEMARTRKTLERVPDDKLAWKPHEKSMTLGRLAGQGMATMSSETFDIAPPGAPPQQGLTATSRQEALDIFDKNIAAARAAIAGASDELLMKPWSLLKGGRTLMTLPKIAVLRSFVMNHMIHHRAQLGVFLRLNNVPVPAIYGPSADEGQM